MTSAAESSAARQPMKALPDLSAPAKINLFLHVTGRGADGYHLLQSAFVLIDWADTLHLECRDDGVLERVDLGAALPDDDLCLKAARALKASTGCRLGARISIDKQIPSGAGMGGGSSDAATTLLGLNRLWGLDLPLSTLMSLGLSLGADVPFFLQGCNAWVEGIGERLQPIPLEPRWLAVIKPAASIPTAAIFASPLLVRNTKPVILIDFLEHEKNQAERLLRRGSSDLGGIGIQGSNTPCFGRNDLQVPAQAVCPSVTEALALLASRFGESRMTGSGSAVFANAGMGPAPVHTMWAADELPAGWVGRMCRSLTRHPLVEVLELSGFGAQASGS